MSAQCAMQCTCRSHQITTSSPRSQVWWGLQGGGECGGRWFPAVHTPLHHLLQVRWLVVRWWHMMMCGDVWWWFMVTCGDLWWPVVVCGDLCCCVVPPCYQCWYVGDFWWPVVICGDYWCLVTDGHRWWSYWWAVVTWNSDWLPVVIWNGDWWSMLWLAIGGNL